MGEAEIKDFFEQQINCWELAKRNFESLDLIKKKSFKVKDLDGYVQYNPARKISTLAKVDKENIGERKCFLCEKNRPKEQLSMDVILGWQLLVNPFPILPYHFTIVNKNHTHQKLEIETGIELADKMPGFIIFYNDDGAGASAPDHRHFQAIPINELPLIKLLNRKEQSKERISLPFRYLTTELEIKEIKSPVNVFFWKNGVNETVKILGIPRKAHRPNEFFLDPPERRAFSPGAIDMGGVLVTPFETDFNKISNSEIKKIFAQVSYS